MPRESIELRFLGTIVRAGMTVADVGAAQGIVTLALAHLVGSTGRVLALEAEPVLLEALEFYAARNAPGTIEVHPLALGGGHIPGTASGPDPARAPVTLDEVMGDQPLHLVRIDARGAEGAVLDGMTRILGRRAPLHIVTAFSPVRLRRAGTDPAGFLDRLWACGFTLGRVDARGCVSIDTAEQLLDGRAGDASVVLHARRVSRIVS